MKRTVVVFAIAALVAPAVAQAHATLVRTRPADGAVLDRAPTVVRVEFDDRVRVASGNAAVANNTGSSVLAGRARAEGRTLLLPLQRGLHDGVYSVRWSIFSDDGHREEGALAFGVGSGSAAPHSVLGASAPLAWNNIVLRTLYVFGLLAAAGTTIFWLLTRSLFGERLLVPLAHQLFFALLAAFLGGSGIAHSAPPGTRFDLVVKIAVTIALVGGAAAALTPTVPMLLYVASACSLALLAAPTLAGHSLDRDQPRVLAPLVDFAHAASAAVWIGGLFALVYVVPRAAADGAARALAVRRFSTTALVSVSVLGLTGLGRALTELSAVHQVWSTSYGRLLIVKTALFAPLLGLGWLNRTVLINAFSRLRRSATAEVALLTAVVVAVAVLTELRPGKITPHANAAPLAAPRAAALPPREAVVDARELGALALAVARTPGQAIVTLLGPDGTGVDGRRVTVDGAAAQPCGSGCYRASAGGGALRIGVNGRTATFHVSARARPASGLLQQVTRAYRTSRTMVFDERLSSEPSVSETTRFRMIAPDKLAYQTRNGPAAVVIGPVRWDRDNARAPWVKSPQTPVRVTQPGWGNPTNVHEIAPGVLTFLDRQVPAWFRVTLGGVRPRRVQMTAAAHFMDDRYVGFDVPVEISPPPSR